MVDFESKQDREVMAEPLLTELMTAFSRRRGIIAICTIACLALGILYHFQAQVRYESTAQIMIMEKDASLPTDGQQGDLGMQVRAADELLGTHMQIVTSRRIVQRAIKDQQLSDLPSIQDHLGEEQRPFEYVQEGLVADRGGEGAARSAHVLRLTYQHPDPEDGARILNAVIKAYQEFLAETVRGAGTQAIDLITQARDELGTELSQKEREYQDFRSEAPLLFSGEQSVNLHHERVSEYEQQLAELRLQRMEVASRLEQVSEALTEENRGKYSDLERLALIHSKDIERLSMLVTVSKGDPLSETFQAAQPERASSANATYTQVLELQVQARRLRELGANHPKYREAVEQLAEARSFLDEKRSELGLSDDPTEFELNELVVAYRRLLESDLLDIDRRQQQIFELAKQEQQEARRMYSYELEDESRRRELVRVQELHDAILGRLREISLLKDYGGYITEVISPVEVGKQAWPNLPVIVALATILGLFVGCGAALIAELVDRSFHTPEEIRSAMQMPILSQVPRFQSIHLPLQRGELAASQMDRSLVTFFQPKTRQAEAFRGLRTALLFAAPSGNQVVQVTSPCPGDGKTTLVGNLGVSLAQAGKRVLVIDCDLRQPRLARFFGLKLTHGLSSVLVRSASPEEAITETDVELLSVLGSGPIPPNPAELLALPTFSQLLEQVREEFDFVLLDSPPLLAVSDPMSIAALADQVVLCMKVRKHGRTDALRAREMLQVADATVLGLVINRDEQASTFVTQDGYGRYAYGADRYGSYYLEDQPAFTNGR